MIDRTNSEIEGTDVISHTSVNTADMHERRIISNDVSSIIEDIRRCDFRDHNILIYPDLPSFRQIYSECTRQALDNNEIVFLATTYDPFDRMEHSLRSKGISVHDEKKRGNLIIVDALKVYQINTFGAINFAKDLVLHAAKDGKMGVFNLSDMGSFFLSERIDALLEYEQSLPKKMNLTLKAICSYHRDNFSKLAEEQQRALLSSHNTVIEVKH